MASPAFARASASRAPPARGLGAPCRPPGPAAARGAPAACASTARRSTPRPSCLLRLLRISGRPPSRPCPCPRHARRSAARPCSTQARRCRWRACDEVAVPGAAGDPRRAALRARRRPRRAGRCSSTCTAAAGSSAISTRTTRPAASSPARPACGCWRSTTGARPSTRSRPPSTTAVAAVRFAIDRGRALRRRPGARRGRRRQRGRQPRRGRGAPADASRTALARRSSS